MGTEGSGEGYLKKHFHHHQHHHSDTEVMSTEKLAFSGPLNQRGGRKSARFSSNPDDDYVEVTIDVRDDSLAVHSVKTAGGGELEDQELTLLARGLEKKSSFGSSVVRNASTKIRQVSQELKRLASLTKRSHAGKLDRSKSAAAHALKGLKFISKTDGGAGWAAVEKRFDELTSATTGLLPRALFGQCIGKSSSFPNYVKNLATVADVLFWLLAGMNKESKEFAGELFDALTRRRNITGELINKAELKEFWEQISDQSFDSRLRTFFDM